MKILVTGAAGFIGSHLCEELLKDKKHNVIGIDDFIGPTPFSLKLKNLKNLLQEKRFTFIKENLLTADLAPLLEGVDVIFHLAYHTGCPLKLGQSFSPICRT
nr:NAD-dependent epimerase/dehydratase family protein [Bacillus subtilis]